MRKISKRIKSNFSFVKFSVILFMVLLIGSWMYIYNVEKADLSSLFSEKNISNSKKFLNGLIGVGEDNIAFYDKEAWKTVLMLTFETLQMSIMAIGFATIGMLLTVIPAARNVAEGKVTMKKRWYSWITFTIVRVIYIFSRAVPELIWAMIIIFVFKPGILPGAVALALHNFGILGKLCAEVIEDLDERPLRNLASSGAGSFQILIYGIVPMVMSKFITYILYRWEVIIRTTIVVGLVGAGGLGMQFKLSMSRFHYTDVTLILICYMILVSVADLLSEKLRDISQ